MQIVFTFFLGFVFYAQLVCAENVKAKDNDDKASDLLCDICIDVVTDLDEWLTSDATMDEIIYFVEGVQKTICNVVLELFCYSYAEPLVKSLKVWN